MGAGRPADRPVVMAAIAGAHGISGEVRLKLFTASADNLKPHARFEAAGRTLTLKSVRPGPQGAVARFAEVDDRTAAEALRGTLLTVPRDSLPAPLGAYKFPSAISFRTCFSSERSATSFFSRPFSCSSWRRRFTSTASNVPYRFRQA